MIAGEKNATDRKTKIRERYKGVDTSRVIVIPAKPIDGKSLEEKPL